MWSALHDFAKTFAAFVADALKDKFILVYVLVFIVGLTTTVWQATVIDPDDKDPSMQQQRSWAIGMAVVLDVFLCVVILMIDLDSIFLNPFGKPGQNTFRDKWFPFMNRAETD